MAARELGMIVYAHIGHWYSVFGFLVPAGLVIAWTRLQARRDRRRLEFMEEWTLELRDDRWRVVAITPAARRSRRPGPLPIASPWSPPRPESELAAPTANGRGTEAVKRGAPAP